MKERTIYGINTVIKALELHGDSLLRIYLQDGMRGKRAARLQTALSQHQVRVERLSADELAELTGTDKHQGVAAAMADHGPLDDHQALSLIESLIDSSGDTGRHPLILVLDSMEDPRNFGACLRTADATGVDLVVVGRSRGIDITPVVSKVASGAAETQPIARVANLARFLRALQALNVWLIGTDESGATALFDANLTGPLALVMGAEGKGLRRLTRECCDALVHLPMLGTVESLNVSVAAGVCLYEAMRQRR
ncbi:MAG: 23S rRNA (guanosine(2251)-2'-O)-methyltransferase RlmB [Gammaproteobacteria bacterium]|nr:23S rRNA (guanosine(2251)-2'-O)-methyltransferase RlmB [Gammaproteobacteria bacterium]